jgi:hypothetical protein
MPTCLFGCEAPKLTKEHIFGRKWIERVTGKPPEAKLTHTHAKVKGQTPFVVDGQERFAIQWDALEAGLVVNGLRGLQQRLDGSHGSRDLSPHRPRGSPGGATP